ncbi:hypothetical protein Tco_0403409 [Tanacetum coccineum]
MMVMMTVVVWWGDSGVVVMERTSGGAWSRGSDRSIDEEYVWSSPERVAEKVFRWPATAAVVVEGWPAVAGQIEGEREVIVIQGLAARNGEMEFVKVILAKSLASQTRKVKGYNRHSKFENSRMLQLLLGSPRVSPLAELIVERQAISMRAVGI